MSDFSWKKLKKPFFCLAPMANVTDCAFRRMFATYGKPDVLWTEFVSADGLVSRGKEKLLVDLKYDKSERPIIAQLFGSNPEKMEQAAKIVYELGFDGVDINMGCPVSDVEKTGSGAALIKSPARALEIIESAKKGALALPVSVKTRLGYSKDESETWLPVLIKSGVKAITIHARTRDEMSKVPARWDKVKEIVEIADELLGKDRPLIIGNGDIKTLEEGETRAKESGCDGVMIGRGAFGSPWFFKKGVNPSPEERIRILIEHIQLFDNLLAGEKSFDNMKKHFKAYVGGFDGAAELRASLMEIKTAHEAIRVLESRAK